jgi:hypothetical protein
MVRAGSSNKAFGCGIQTAMGINRRKLNPNERRNVIPTWRRKLNPNERRNVILI